MDRTLRGDLARCKRLERRLVLKELAALLLVALTIVVRALWFT
jgi:hypothetical protein